ncbi:MAG: DUF2868 domain-containing protein [Desulfobulbaceae bacterium]|nr:DUF2868 domain-containing protein [Desulfobulbaceae bacterium]
MKTNWQYNNIIDLEFFCHQDSGADNNRLHQRDRDIYLENQEQLNNQKKSRKEPSDEPSNCDLISLWLTERLRSDFPGPAQKSPGTIFGDTYLLARNLAVIKGIFVGLIAGFSFFSYTGTTPVNVFHFLLIFVVSQLAFAGFLIGACLLRPLLPRLKIPSFYSLLFRGMMANIVAFFNKQWLRTVATEKRVSINHAFGIFKARSAVYGSLFYWPLFALSQLFAIGFNIGLLAATLLKISTSDLAFGWQSTMQFGAATIHHGVALVALPWSWFVAEANSYPSLAEIEGSRIILKEGIYHLTTENLIAWWPFLVFCLLFYGLFLRMALFFVGKVMERTSLQNLQLDTPDCLALIRRMQTPLVSTQAKPEQKKTTTEKQTETPKEAPPPFALNLVDQVVLVPDDIYTLCPAEELVTLLQSRGFAIKDIHRFMVSYDQDLQVKELLASKEWQPGEGIFILLEGWMVPLTDFLSYLKELRAILPRNAIINLALIGRPDATIFTPVAPQDFTIWQQKIEAVGDPYLTIFSLIP